MALALSGFIVCQECSYPRRSQRRISEITLTKESFWIGFVAAKGTVDVWKKGEGDCTWERRKPKPSSPPPHTHTNQSSNSLLLCEEGGGELRGSEGEEFSCGKAALSLSCFLPLFV